MKPIKQRILMMIAAVVFCSCNEFLAEKTDKKLVVPASTQDFQAMLDNAGIINNADPAEGEIAGDDYYLPESIWSGMNPEDREAYLWLPGQSGSPTSWMTSYRNVYYANVILKALHDGGYTTHGNGNEKDNIAGQAYFLRGKSLLSAVSLWSQAYDDNSADNDLGIPLRLDPDFNLPSSRASNRITYGQIISDLLMAIDLLPEKPVHVLRASKGAAHGLLARVYLFMRDYENCLAHAGQCLMTDDTLINYNILDTNATFTFEMFNSEILYASNMVYRSPIQDNMARVDTVLIGMYGAGDLRKDLFFRPNSDGTFAFKGSYGGGYNVFSGVAIDEIYLMEAECLARRDELNTAAARLNMLLEKRYQPNSFVPVSVIDQQQLLSAILDERRKELLFRGLRFPDVKRLNKEERQIGFKRLLNFSGQEYKLPPNDLRFTLPIPPSVLNRAPEIVQNPY